MVSRPRAFAPGMWYVLRLASKSLTSMNTQVALMNIAKAGENLYGLAQVLSCNDCIHINDRLGIQPRHGSASDVFDSPA